MRNSLPYLLSKTELIVHFFIMDNIFGENPPPNIECPTINTVKQSKCTGYILNTRCARKSTKLPFPLRNEIVKLYVNINPDKIKKKVTPEYPSLKYSNDEAKSLLLEFCITAMWLKNTPRAANALRDVRLFSLSARMIHLCFNAQKCNKRLMIP